MLRWVLFLTLLAVTACGGSRDRELPQTSLRDPIIQLNPGKWSFNDNVLTHSGSLETP